MLNPCKDRRTDSRDVLMETLHLSQRRPQHLKSPSNRTSLTANGKFVEDSPTDGFTDHA